MINLLETLQQVEQLARQVGQLQKQQLGREDLQIEVKSTAIDLVTEVDKQSEQMILEFIRSHYPGHAILAEESGLAQTDSEYLWVIDPLDGTINYAQGLPIFAVSIALQLRGETVLGVVYAPVPEQMFTAVKGYGAYLNGQKLRVSAKTELVDCVLATGFPYDIASNPANNINYFSAIVTKTRAIRRMGAAAYDLACVAAGKFDGYWELNLSPWDIAAAVLMVEEAGGEIRHFRTDRKLSIIAGNAAVCHKLQEEIRGAELA